MNELILRQKANKGQTLYQKNRLKIEDLVCQASKLLMIKPVENNQEVIDFCETVYRKCKKFELSDKVHFLGIQIAEYLEFESENIEQRRKVNKYLNESKLYFDYYKEEIKLRIQKTNTNKILVRKLTLEKRLKDIYSFLQSIDKNKIKTYQGQLYYYRILLDRYELENNNPKIIETCNLALDIFRKKTFRISDTIYLAFILPKIPIYIKSGQYQKAKEDIYTCYGYCKKGNNNWLAVHSYDVIIAFRMNDFEKVGTLLSKVKKHPNIIVKERYLLYRAYYYLSLESNLKINRFLNQTLQFSRDKTGYNIAIVIIKLLHLIKQKKHDEFIDLVEKTNQYIKEWLKQKKVLRSKIFLRILLSFPRIRFNTNLIYKDDKIKRYIAELKKIDIKTSNLEIEMVDYEVLLKRIEVM